MSLTDFLIPGDPVVNHLVRSQLGGGGKSGSQTPLSDQYGADTMQQFNQQFPGFLQGYESQSQQGKGGRTFEQWLADGWQENPNDAGNVAAMNALTTFKNTGSWPANTPAGQASAGTDAPVPTEQGIYNIVEGSLVNDINQDQGRQQLAGQLGTQLTNDYNTAQGTLQSALGPTFDSETYFKNHPDVAAAYAQSDHSQTPQQFALAAYKASGENNNSYFSSQLQRDDANADTTAGSIVSNDQASANTQLDALQKYTDAAKTSLSGDLAARAQALSDQIASLQSNQSTYTQAQKDALAQQIQTQLGDLNDSIAQQKDALTQQISTLQNATDAESQQQLAAVKQQLASLNAAEAPVAAARNQAAQDQVTGVNLGLQQTNDTLDANRALQGYIGGSSMDEGNLARAAITARQNAAGLVGTANLTNAQDYQGIANTGANETNSIGQAIAGQRYGITSQGANGMDTLANALATGTQNLKDTGATGLAAITSAGALGQKGISDQGANTTYANSLYGADASKAIADNAAAGNQSITDALAGQTATANNAGAAAKSQYYDNNYNRTLGAALTSTQLASGLTSDLTNLDNYGQSGLNRTLGTLNWWNSAATPSTPGYVAASPDTSGNSLSTLGAGLLGLGAKIGSANNWWTTPTTNTPAKQNTGVGTVGTGWTYTPVPPDAPADS